MDIKKSATNPTLENEGVLVEFDSETKFRIGSVNSRRYRQAYSEAIKNMRRITRNPTPEQSENVTLEVYAEAILLGWEGVKDDGKEFPYSKANALLLLKTCPSAKDFVFVTANDHETFRQLQTEEAQKSLGEH